MNAELTPELTQMRDALRKFVRAQLEPLEDQIDRTGELPPHLLPLMGKQGYLSMRLPVEVGGAGMGLFPYCLMLEEFSRSHRVFGILASGGGGLTPIAISRHGTPEQRKQWVAPTLTGEKKLCFAITEPDAGTNSFAMTTYAQRDGEWRALGLAAPARRALINAGLTTASGLAGWSYADIAGLHGIGKNALAILRPLLRD